MKPVRERVFNEFRCPARNHLYDKVLNLRQTDWNQALDEVKYNVQNEINDLRNLVWYKTR